MLLIRQVISNDECLGVGTREVILKRFIFRCRGNLYVYTSSVPETAIEQLSEDEIREDDIVGKHRYTEVFTI